MSRGKEIAMSGGSRERADLVLMAALASGKQIQLAAAEAGVSERTVFRRLASPAFQQQLAGVQSKVMDASIGLLSQAFRIASEKLVTLLGSGSESMQLRAAQAILTQMTAVRLSILSDLQEPRATVATDTPARTLTPTATDCQTSRKASAIAIERADNRRHEAMSSSPDSGLDSESVPNDALDEILTRAATDCQITEAPVVTVCHKPVPVQVDNKREPEPRSKVEPAESLPPTDTGCQMPRSPNLSGLKPTSRQTDVSPQRLPPDTDCHELPTSTRSNRRRDRVKRPHLGWGIALPMSFQ
jgi:hypothetical protein